MTRSVIRRADWSIAADVTPGASPPIYEMECTTCLDTSGTSEAPEDVQDWALQHSGRNPSHRGFRGVITNFWRTELLNTRSDASA